jgi:hypothetical protein
MQRLVRRFADVDLEKVTVRHLYTATVVRLPFHLCTGSLFNIVDPEDPRLGLWIRNRVSIPSDMDIHAALSQPIFRDDAALFTDVVLVNRKPKVQEQTIEAIRNGRSDAPGFPDFNNPAFALLRDVLAAHQMVRIGPYFAGIGASWPRILTLREIHEGILVEYLVIDEVDAAVDEGKARELFGHVDRIPFGPARGGIGDIRDYSADQLQSLVEGVTKVREHAFHELYCNAISAQLRGDRITAIILACAAAEGAHGAYLRARLKEAVTDPAEFNELANAVLREQGFFSLVQLTARMLMPKADRPSEDTLLKSKEGISIRNSIMHAGIDRHGQYKFRKHKPADMEASYSALLSLCRTFETALRRVPSEDDEPLPSERGELDGPRPYGPR